MSDKKRSPTSAGTALWNEVLAARERGEPGPAAKALAEWEALTDDEKVAAVKAGTALWPEPDLCEDA